MFKELINNITKIFNNKELPTYNAHKQMLPYSRLNIDYLSEQYKSVKCSVLILLYPSNCKDFSIVLIKRQDYKGVHSGQIAFPGGKQEITDINTEHTAIRETFEEIGVKISFDNIIGKLNDIYIHPSNSMITPIVAYLDYKPLFKANTYEVKEIIEVSIDEIIDENNVSEDIFKTSYGRIKAPCFNFGTYKVWGATAMIINELKAILKVTLPFNR